MLKSFVDFIKEDAPVNVTAGVQFQDPKLVQSPFSRRKKKKRARAK